MSSRILSTGGAGFIGSHLADDLPAQGYPVRDTLHVEDPVEALPLSQQHLNKLAGQVFDIGGGQAKTTSLLELMEMTGELHGRNPEVPFADWRPADHLCWKLSWRWGWRG